MTWLTLGAIFTLVVIFTIFEDARFCERVADTWKLFLMYRRHHPLRHAAKYAYVVAKELNRNEEE